MTNVQKIFIGLVALVVWCATLAVHHLYQDIDVAVLVATAQAVLVGLGVTHIGKPAQDPNPTQPKTASADSTSDQ